jgi:hypothetical protein
MKCSVLSLALAATSATSMALKQRTTGTELSCDSYDELTEGPYSLYHN